MCWLQAKERTARDVQQLLEDTSRTGVALCSDGWSDVTNKPLLNVMVVTTKGAIFDSAINAAGEVKVNVIPCSRLTLLTLTD